jgi:16S rRNA (cytidine1402-2'-O)-methyltransferase
MIDHFVLFNEHTEPLISQDLLAKLRQGTSMVLMSDCGLPGIFDPGQTLISLCWKNGVEVSSLPFPNSTLLALALSGFPCAPHYLAGFLARDELGRQEALERLLRNFPCGITILDTPYRYATLLSAILKLHQAHPALTQGREVFVACDLNTPEQECHRFPFQDLANFCQRAQGQKREFIFIVGPIS